MKLPQQIKSRIIVITGMIVLLLVIITVGLNISIEFFNRKLINDNKVYTENTARALSNSISLSSDSLQLTSILLKDSLSQSEKTLLDSSLSVFSKKIFINIPGTEGGFYLISLNEFTGYSYPSSPPPIPLFGPPPRSYQIIKDQVLKSIQRKEVITGIHKFDPAVFPLTTSPVWIKSKLIGIAWTRIHIERDLPILKFKEIANIAAGIAILGFIVILFITFSLRSRIEEIKQGLEKVQVDSTYRLKDQPGMFGFISQSINKMVESLQEENNKRQELERELHQHDKMASLGKLVAGVAHEVKTPLAIIKTRIQMWERELKKLDSPEHSKIITQESIQLVVNEINRLSNLVKRLLVFSKPVASKFTKNDLNNVLAKTLSLVGDDFTEKKITLSTEFDSKIPAILFDPNALEQVFINLYMNSIEAMPDGGNLYLKTILHKSCKVVEIILEDTGSGIPVDVMNKVFDPFFSTKQHGAGLGLSIAYEVITMHRGKIEFLQPGETGTICKITLPTD
jgi:signal transduction histidine kinase